MKTKFFKLIVLSMLVTAFSSCVNDKAGDLSYVKWNEFTTVGLNDRIYAVSCDSTKNVWVGTDNGAFKFDGQSWTNYRSFGNNSQIKAIATDGDNNIWFGTNGAGVAKYKAGSWTYYRNDPTLPNTISSNFIYSIAIDSYGIKWIGTDNGVCKFDGQNWTVYKVENGLAENHVFSIAIDKQGNKWFGTNGGVSKFNDTSWVNYVYSKDNSNGIVGNGVLGIAIDNQGNKWFATFGGLSEFDGTTWTNFKTQTDWLKSGSPVLSAAIDAKGHKWFGSNGMGISEFDGVKWTTYTMANSSIISPVNAIAKDTYGNLWFGTSSGLLELTK